MIKFFSVILFLSFIILCSCSKDETNVVDCTGMTPTYKNDIASIFNASCATAGCHDAVTKAEGINLSTYASSKSASQNTKVLKSIKHDSGANAMPQGSAKLSDAIINKVACWIQNGYQE
ncbi:MAG: cytochrome c [Saprospiraceae bacterium]|nr:cytochrome c [Saprospiraceae bacterium]